MNNHSLENDQKFTSLKNAARGKSKDSPEYRAFAWFCCNHIAFGSTIGKARNPASGAVQARYRALMGEYLAIWGLKPRAFA